MNKPFMPYLQDEGDFLKKSTLFETQDETLRGVKKFNYSASVSAFGVGFIKFSVQKKWYTDKTVEHVQTVGISKNIKFNNDYVDELSLTFGFSVNKGNFMDFFVRDQVKIRAFRKKLSQNFVTIFNLSLFPAVIRCTKETFAI